MANILVDSIDDAKKATGLLKKNIPNYRQAYSDRTCWLMACISELAYVRFNPIFKNTAKDYFIKKVSDLVDENNIQSLRKLIDTVRYDPEEERENLKESSEFLNLELVETFDINDT